MHPDKVYVTPTEEGGWLVRSAQRNQENPTVFRSKIDALEEALNRTTEDKLMVYSATGQLIPRLDYPTSVPKERMFKAVLSAIRKKYQAS